MRRLKFAASVILLFCVHTSFAQNGQEAGTHAEQALNSLRQARLYENSREPDSAAIYRMHLRDALRHHENAGTTVNHANINHLIASSMHKSFMLDSTAVYLRRGIGHYEKNPADSDTGEKLYTLAAIAYTHLGKPDSTIIYAHKLLGVLSEEEDPALTARTYYNIARAYDDMGMREETLEYYRRALELSESTGNHRTAQSTYLALATLNYNDGNSETGLSMAEKGVEHAKLWGDLTDLGLNWGTMATGYYNLGRFDEAMAAYEEAARCFDEAGNQQFVKLMHTGMINVRLKEGEKKKAYELIVAEAPTENFDSKKADTDSLVFPESHQDLQLRLSTADLNVADKTMKFDALYQEHLERQARSLRLQIILISALAVLVTAALLLLYNRQRQKARAEAAARYAQEKENEYITLQQESELRMIRKYIDGLESERSRISKELHDGVCNDLLALEMELKNNGGDIAAQTAFLHRTRENIRSVSHELMPPAFQYAAIDEIVADYVSHLHTPEGTTVEYSQAEDADWSAVPQNTAFEVYRITQEAAGNSIKHAGATRIVVSLTIEGGELALEVSDNGRGFERADRNRGAGLKIIAERVESIGGRLDIDTGSGGTTVRAVFKLK